MVTESGEIKNNLTNVKRNHVGLQYFYIEKPEMSMYSTHQSQRRTFSVTNTHFKKPIKKLSPLLKRKTTVRYGKLQYMQY